MKEEALEKIVKAINEKTNFQHCPMCNSRNLSVTKGLIIDIIYETTIDPYERQKSALPLIGVLCDNCGHLMHFAVKALLPEWDKIKNDVMK